MSMRIGDGSNSHPDDDWFAPIEQSAAAREDPPRESEPSSEHEPEWEVEDGWEHDDPTSRDAAHRHIGIVLAVIVADLPRAGRSSRRAHHQGLDDDRRDDHLDRRDAGPTTPADTTPADTTPADTTPADTTTSRHHTGRHDTSRHDAGRNDPGHNADLGPDRHDAPPRNQGLPVRRDVAGRPHEPRVRGRDAGRKLRPVDRRGRLGLPDGERPHRRRRRGAGDARGDQHGPREGLTPPNRGSAAEPAGASTRAEVLLVPDE